jgi:hypothetical protein
MKKNLFIKSVLFLLTIIFGVIGIFGVLVSANLVNGIMTDCPFMQGEHSVCDMNILDHINMWQTIFVAMQNFIFINLMNFIIAIFVIVSVLLFSKFLNSLENLQYIKDFLRRNFLELQDFISNNYLFFSFSKGEIKAIL